jgi:hypothetical protein
MWKLAGLSPSVIVLAAALRRPARRDVLLAHPSGRQSISIHSHEEAVMKTGLIGAAILIAGACVALTFASCDNRGTNPDGASGSTGGNGKQRDLLSCLNMFPGITSCSLGGAVLAPGPGTINVNGMFNAATDGVSSNFPNTQDWSQDISVVMPPGGTGSLHYTSFSDHGGTSTLDVNQVGNDVTFRADFSTAPDGAMTYTLEFYNGGSLVFVQPGIGPAAPALRAINIGQPISWVPCWRLVRFRVNGRCIWYWVNYCTQIYSLPFGGQVIADEVRFVEDPAPGGYLYHNLNQITVTGHVDSYSITNETV